MEKIRNKLMRGSHGQRDGFTLIEIMVVVVILGIAMVMAVPMFSSAGSVQVDSAANMIASGLEYARSMAITRQQNYSMEFDKTNNSYQVVDHNGTVIENPVKIGFDYKVEFAKETGVQRVVITGVNIDSGSKVTFDYIGAPYNEGATEMVTGQIAITAGEITRTIKIEPVTGYISIE